MFSTACWTSALQLPRSACVWMNETNKLFLKRTNQWKCNQLIWRIVGCTTLLQVFANSLKANVVGRESRLTVPKYGWRFCFRKTREPQPTDFSAVIADGGAKGLKRLPAYSVTTAFLRNMRNLTALIKLSNSIKLTTARALSGSYFQRGLAPSSASFRETDKSGQHN